MYQSLHLSAAVSLLCLSLRTLSLYGLRGTCDQTKVVTDCQIGWWGYWIPHGKH